MLPVKLMPSPEMAERRQPMDENIQNIQLPRGNPMGFSDVSPENDIAAPIDRFESTFGLYAKNARELPRDEYVPSIERKAYEAAKTQFLPPSTKTEGFVPRDPFGKELELVPPDPLPWEEARDEFTHPHEQEACSVCADRKYVDRSDDMSVTFQVPTKVAPQQARAAVKHHEQQHVREHQRQADSKDLKVMSQSVTIKYAICPCCGQRYVKGGLTQTVTANKGYEIYKKLHGDSTSNTEKCH